MLASTLQPGFGRMTIGIPCLVAVAAHIGLIFTWILRLLRAECWKIDWRLSCICSPSKVRLPRFLLCPLVLDASPIWLSASIVALSSSTAKWSMEGTAQCASMLFILFLMFASMLASESRMVAHVTVCAMQSRVFGGSSIKIKHRLDPLQIKLLILFAQILILWNWTFWIGLFAWTQIGFILVDFTNVSPSKSFLLWICSICWIGWNALVSF